MKHCSVLEFIGDFFFYANRVQKQSINKLIYVEILIQPRLFMFLLTQQIRDACTRWRLTEPQITTKRKM